VNKDAVVVLIGAAAALGTEDMDAVAQRDQGVGDVVGVDTGAIPNNGKMLMKYVKMENVWQAH